MNCAIENSSLLPYFDSTKLINFSYLEKAFEVGNIHVASFDAEWTPCSYISEIGVTVFKTGVWSSHNVILDKHEGFDFLYGNTVRMSSDEAREWLYLIFTDVELLIGHSLKHDRTQLDKWGWKFPDITTIDTALWSRKMFPEARGSSSLEKLATHYGIEHPSAHCGGNDAMVTMRVAFEMLKDAKERSRGC